MSDLNRDKFAFIAGSALLDIVSTVTNYRHIEDNIGTTTLNFGGVAYNVAVNLRKMNVPTVLCTAMNDSPITQMILNELTNQNVRTYVKIDKNLPDAIYNGTFYKGKEISSVWVNTVEKIKFSEAFIKKGLDNAVCMLITSCLSVESMNTFIKIANKQGIPVFVGGASLMEVEKIKDIKGKVDYFFLNDNEMNLLTKKIKNASCWLDVAKIKQSSFIVTKGADGVELYTPNGQIKIYKTEKIEVRGNSLGAGDLFMSVTINEMFFNGRNLCNSIKYAMKESVNILNRDDANIGTHKPLSANIQMVTDKAHHDKLTGALNRNGIERYLTAPNIIHTKLHMLVIDADFFKKINDTYGHNIGDEALVSIVRVIQEIMRKNDIVARFGGEEFICLLKNMTNKQAFNIAERIRKSISNKKHTSKNINISVSIGLCKWQKDDTLDSVLKRADNALYKAKDTGRNVVITHK